MCLPDEAGNVDINKCGHEVLTVKPIHNATMTRDSVGKILKAQKTVQYFSLYMIKLSTQSILHRVQTQLPIIPTLILKALLKPLAKKPPKGPTMEAKVERAMLWIWNG